MLVRELAKLRLGPPPNLHCPRRWPPNRVSSCAQPTGKDAMHAKLELLLVFLALSLAACGSRTILSVRDSGTTTAGAGGESASREAGTPEVVGDACTEGGREVPPFVLDDASASFCSGDSARMVLNGSESSPVVTGRRRPASCCFVGQFHVATETFAEPLMVNWEWFDTLYSSIPISIDLSSPPDDWRISVTAGCDPFEVSCKMPSDLYTSGLQGVLEVTLHDTVAWDMSLCLHVEQPAGSSHPVIYALDLYAPHVQASF